MCVVADSPDAMDERGRVFGQVCGMGVAGEPGLTTTPERVRLAVAQLFDDYAESIFTYAARRVGALEARDVVSEVFLVAIDRFDTYRPDLGSTRGWLFGIANNVLRHHWRSENRRLRAMAREASRTVVPSDTQSSADTRLDAHLDAGRIVEQVRRMPADDRDLLIMLAWHGMPHADIADALAIPIGTVRSRLHRLRRQLESLDIEGDST